MYSLDLHPPPKFALHFFRRRGPSYCTSCATTMPPTAGSNFLETRTLARPWTMRRSGSGSWSSFRCRLRCGPALILQGVVSLFSFSELLHPKGLLPCSAKGSGTSFGHLLSIGSTAFARLVGRLSVLGVTPPPACAHLAGVTAVPVHGRRD